MSPIKQSLKAPPVHWNAENCSQEQNISAFAQSLLIESKREVAASRISSFQQAGGDRAKLLEQAIKCDYAALIPLLLSKETVDLPVRCDDTPLHVACHQKSLRCIKALLALGATIDLPGRNGMTPLHYSILVADPEGEDILITKGANPIKQDNRGETPYSLPFKLGNRRGCRHVLNKCKELPQNIPFRKSEVSSIESKSLILPFLIQDAKWIQTTVQKMPENRFQEELALLRTRFPAADLTMVQDAHLSLHQKHLLELTTIAQSNLPEQEKLDKQDLAELIPLFDCINLTDPDKPGYRNPANIRDANGHTYTAEELRGKLTELVSDVAKRTPKAGIPPLDLESCSEALYAIEATLSAEKRELLSDTFYAIQTYVNRKEISPKLQPLIEKLHEALTHDEITPLLPFLKNMQRFESWYADLENMLKGLLLLIKEEPFDDATPTLLELALTGGNCGGWYLGEATKLYEQKSGKILDLRAQVLNILGNHFQRIVESHLNPLDGQNRHQQSSILCALDRHFGITDEEAAKRPHFADPLHSSYKVSERTIEDFKKIYTPTMLISVINEAVNGEKPLIDRELLVDWIKQHIPSAWKEGETISPEDRSYSYLSDVVYDLETGKIKRSYLVLMLTKLNILNLK